MAFKPTQPAFPAGSVESRDINAALAARGMLWTAEFRPLFLESAESLGGIEAVDGIRALVRSDNGKPVGFHGGAYTPVQNAQTFAGIQPLLDSGDAVLTRVRELDGGRKVAVEAELTGNGAALEVKLGDVVRQKVIFSNSHDGTSPVAVSYVVERLVCLNGMTRPNRSTMFRGRHTAGVHAALEHWRAEFAENAAALGRQVEVWRAFAQRRVNDRALRAYVRETLSPGAGADDSIVVRGVDRIVELAHTAPGADPGTLWGAVNAVTYWATHERGREGDARDVANLFGQGGALIERATEVATLAVDRLPMIELARESHANHATAKAELDLLLGRPARLPFEMEA